MATKEQFNKDNDFGKIAEIKTKELLERRGHEVIDISGNFVASDLLVDKEIAIEVKHQKCVGNNKLFIEIATPKNLFGWFFKDSGVSFYCFYYDNIYHFIEVAGLHKYVAAEFPGLLDSDKYYKIDKFGFKYIMLDINKVSKYFKDNNLFYQRIDDRTTFF